MDLDHIVRLDVIRNAMNEMEKVDSESIEDLIDKVFSDNSETLKEMEKFFSKIEDYPLSEFILSMQTKYKNTPKELEEFHPKYYLLIVEDINNKSTNNFESVLKPELTKLFEEANLK